MDDPELYEKFKEYARVDMKRCIPELIEKVDWKIGENIIDYGCGAGSNTVEYFLPKAIENMSKIDGIDCSQSMIEYAKLHWNHPLIMYEVENIMQPNSMLLQHKKSYYGKIFMIYVLPFIKDYRSAFRKFYELLEAGGQIGFTTISKHNTLPIFEKMAETEKWMKYLKGMNNLGYNENENAHEEICSALVDAGFNLEYSKVIQSRHNFPIETYIGTIYSLNPFIKKIPKELIDEFKEELTERFLECSAFHKDEPDFNFMHEVSTFLATKLELNAFLHYVQKLCSN